MFGTAGEIKDAISCKSRNFKAFCIQHDDNKESAQKFRKQVFESSFYRRHLSYGWCEHVLNEPEKWYHALNGDNRFEPRSLWGPTEDVWYKCYEPTCVAPDGKEAQTWEEVKTVTEELDDYATSTSHLCEHVLLIHISFVCCCCRRQIVAKLLFETRQE